MIKDFKAFLFKGDVISLAVALVIGLAFTAIIGAFVEGIINPIIAEIANADGIAEVKTGIFGTGLVLAAIINFIIVGFVLFMLVKAADKAMPKEEAPPAGPTAEVVLLTEIRDSLRSPR